MSPDDETTYTVGTLNRLIRQALARRFPDEVWVEGEIRGLKRHERSGHVYFELVDSSADGRQTDAAIAVALYKTDKDAVNRLLRRAGAVRMDDGVHIRIRGSIDYYPPQGRLQLRMQWIDPDHTLGRLEAERRRLLDALGTEGLLERNRSLPYPVMPLRVGLVTSIGSAAHQDFLHELTASGLAWKVVVAHAAVQGPAAEVEVTAALRTLAAACVDVIAVVRGGGARTDLAAFDTEGIARAIATLDVPVLTGIGHETDQVVADLVAAHRAKTPTACAAQLVAQATAGHERAHRAWEAIARRARLDLDRSHHHLERVATRVSFSGRRQVERRAERIEHHAAQVLAVASRAPDDATVEVHRLGTAIDAAARRHVGAAEAAVLDHRRRLTTSAPRSLRRQEGELVGRAARIAAADPGRLLARGWAVLRGADDQVLTSVRGLRVGQELRATLADGDVRATVEAIDPAAPPAPPSPPAPSRPETGDDDGMQRSTKEGPT